MPKSKNSAPHNGNDEDHRGDGAPAGCYLVACSNAAVRRLIVTLLRDDEFYDRFHADPIEILEDAGIHLPNAMAVDMAAFERRHLKKMAETPGPLLNLTIGGRPLLVPRARPSQPRRNNHDD